MDFPSEWYGWYFYERFLCSPNGDRFQPNQVMACFYYRQYEDIRLMINNPIFVEHLQKLAFLQNVKEIDLLELTTTPYINMTLALPFPNYASS